MQVHSWISSINHSLKKITQPASNYVSRQGEQTMTVAWSEVHPDGNGLMEQLLMENEHALFLLSRFSMSQSDNHFFEKDWMFLHFLKTEHPHPGQIYLSHLMHSSPALSIPPLYLIAWQGYLYRKLLLDYTGHSCLQSCTDRQDKCTASRNKEQRGDFERNRLLPLISTSKVAAEHC